MEAGTPSANQFFVDAFMAGLRESGYLPDKNIVVDVRWAEGTADGFRRALAELIQRRPDVIVVSSAVGALEAKRATSSIPIVFIGVPTLLRAVWSRDWPSPVGRLDLRGSTGSWVIGRRGDAVIAPHRVFASVSERA